MLPRVIIHNSVSLDGSLTGFDVQLDLHYGIAARFGADMHLVGSNSAKTGMEAFLEEIPKESEADFSKPKKEGLLWAIPDTTGKLKGLLHVLRQSEYCRDPVVLLSQKTPEEYVSYLRERNYEHRVVGDDKCDLRRALQTLGQEYGAQTILVDAGAVLSNLLIEQGLVSEISLLVHPVIVGRESYYMFGNLKKKLQLRLMKRELLNDECLWLVYGSPQWS